MTIKAVLLDLDDTLLINDMETFAPHYFRALVAKVQHLVPGPVFAEALNLATQAMWHNDGRDGSNADVFRAVFFPHVERQPQEMMPLFDDFYRHEFETLRKYTHVDRDARALVELLFAKGFQVAIATQPVFPLAAIEARLRWAGVGADEFPYAFIPSYETMHACKPHPRYFRFYLEHLGWRADECLMVGDSVESDLAAGELGFKTFWVVRGRAGEAQNVRCSARGSLRDLMTLISTRRIHDLK